MKEGWEIKKLVDVCIVERGSSPRPIEKYQTDSPYGVNWIKIGDTKGIDKYIYNTKEKITKEGAEKSRYVKEGDFILSNSMSFGKPFIMKTDGYIHDGWFVLRLHKFIDTEYFFNLLSSPYVNDQFHKLASGSVVKNISGDLVKKVVLPIPSLSEQQRIVAILDEAFAAIAKAKANAVQNLKNAKELFESYLQSMFENKGEGWEEKMFGEVLLKTESVDPTKKPDEEFIYLDVSSVNKETKEIENASSVMGKDAPSRARKLIRTNDVIFATVRPTHSRVALITEEYNEQVCSTGYFVLRAKDFLNNNLVYYFLLTYGFNKQMEKLQKGASYPAVNDSDVKGIIIPFPKSLKEQQTIVQKLDAFSTETKKLEAIYQQKINNLEELKKSILQKAFSGELKEKLATV
jgi:type I restriction enzyme S subunit